MVLVIAAIHLLMACTTPEQHERDKLTDLIEARVKLPKGARLLADYARSYAFDDNGLVVGVYAPGYVAPNPEDKCEEMLEDFTSRDIPCPLESDGNRLRSGQRQWVDNINKLPAISDGGCSVLTVLFDVKRGVVKDTFCNGEA